MAVDDDLIRKNPFQFPLSDILHDDTQKRVALTPEQEAEFLRFIWQDDHFREYYEVVYILLNTGMRISEFCGLTPNEVDYDKGCIYVTGQLVRHSNMITSFEPTKTDAGYRSIPMTPEVADCFHALEEKRETPACELEIDGRSGFFCLDMNGRPTVALHWEHYFQHIVAKYNETYKEPLPKITPHVCRHTFCSKMARMGMNPKCLQYIMGHSEISVTMDTYTHLQFEDALADFLKVTGQKAEKKN
ncbi:MAG TPA: site-specific integrase [Methanocorpusculum sp.]|nr:site-specific integrase [Methanocorpusculum sp.]